MIRKTLSLTASLIMSATALKLTQEEAEPLQLAQELRQRTTLELHINSVNHAPAD